MTEPLKITCKLLDGRVNSLDGIFALDSILYYAWFLENASGVIEGTQEYEEQAQLGYDELPLERLPENRFACSWGFYTEYEQNIEYWVKRPNFSSLSGLDYLDIKGKSGKVVTSSGSLKAYRMPQVVRVISNIEFYCVGIKSELEKLLSLITHIGKKAAMGWGAIKEWDINSFPADWSTYSEKYGVMRPLELHEAEKFLSERRYEIRTVGIRPPYWKHENQKVCVLPEVNYCDVR